MRTRSTQDDRIFSAKGQATWLRVDLQDASLAWNNVGALRGYDFIDSARMSVSPDQPTATAQISLKREIFKLSLAPYVAASVLNKLGGGTKLVHPNEGVRLYVQIQPAGAKADPSAWKLIFEGQIDSPDSGQDPLVLDCSDLVTRLQRAWIKTERAYGVWQPAQGVIANVVVVATATATNGANNPDAPAGPWWQAQGTFTTGGTEPAWPASPTPGTTTVSDNGGTWKCIAGPTGTPIETQIQQILNDNSAVAGSWTLYCPTATSEVVKPYVQSGMSVFDAIQRLADIIGWLVRWKWDDGTSAFRLTLFDPGRSNTTSLYTIPKSKYEPIASFKEDLTNVRNDIDGRVFDSATLDSSGNPTPTTVNYQDAASIALYGDLYAAVAEPAGSPINTVAAMQKMVNAIGKDLSQAPVQMPVVFEHAWWFEPGDVVTVGADGLHFDSDQKLAVFQMDHDFAQGGASKTTLGLRGTPSGGHKRWAGKFAAGGLNGGPLKLSNPAPPLAVTAVAAIRGARLSFPIPSSKQSRYDYSELHISTTTPFTPSSSTLKATARSGHFLLGDLTPGTTYYAKVIHKDVRGNASSPSAQVSFVADQVQATDLSGALRTGFKRKSVAPNTSVAISNGGDMPAAWDTVVQDTLGVSTAAGLFNPGTNGPVFGELRYHLHIRGANLTPGCSAVATLQVGATVIATSARAFATDSANTYHQPEILLDFKVKHVFAASTIHKVLVTVVDADGTAVTGCYLAAERGVATLAAVGRGASVHVGEQYLDPTGTNGHVYRVTTGNITNAGAVTYSTVDYFGQTDGTAVLTEDGANAPRVGTFFEFMPSPS